MHLKNRSSIYIPIVVAAALVLIALLRTDVTLDKISSPLLEESSLVSEKALSSLLQPYVYLDKGRQSFVFQSLDGKTVLKFFNRTYFEMPWYGYFSLKERQKREKRKLFFSQSYALAEKYLAEETGILYFHRGKSENLPVIELKLKTNRIIHLDLNQVPFVLQKKAEPFYETLLNAKEETCEQILRDFLKIVNLRMQYKIKDAEHQVEHNFGFLDGKPIYIDPGRLFLSDSSSWNEHYEWWGATHSLRKWLARHLPKTIPFFDRTQREFEEKGH